MLQDILSERQRKKGGRGVLRPPPPVMDEGVKRLKNLRMDRRTDKVAHKKSLSDLKDHGLKYISVYGLPYEYNQ